MSALEEMLAFQIQALKLPEPVREHQFAAEHVGRERGVKQRLREAGLKNWRFDFAWPDRRFAVEVEGGGWTGGGHTRGAGFRDDLVKYHHALRLGWVVYRCDGDMVKQGIASQMVVEFLEGGWHERNRARASENG